MNRILLPLLAAAALPAIAAAQTGKPPAKGTPPLTERLPADKRAAFTKAVTDLGLPANALDKFKPWLAATVAAVVCADG